MVAIYIFAGAAMAFVLRALFVRTLLFKLRRDVAQLNTGNYTPLLQGYSADAVLHFNEGEHRWAGEHRGKPAIERFLCDFTTAGLQGELTDCWIAGPPWSLRLAARFNDEAHDPQGNLLYRNRTALVAQTRWGKITEQWDFYEDTGRIAELEKSLAELGVAPASA